MIAKRLFNTVKCREAAFLHPQNGKSKQAGWLEKETSFHYCQPQYPPSQALGAGDLGIGFELVLILPQGLSTESTGWGFAVSPFDPHMLPIPPMRFKICLRLLG